MKKHIAALLCLVLIAGILPGCGSSGAAQPGTQKKRIVTTIFPEYDWVRQVLGEEAERFELTLLLDKGVDMHSYQPTADNMVTISTCDLFVYVGGESDEWVDDALAGKTNPKMAVVRLMDVLGDAAKEEEIVEGMQEDAESAEEEAAEYDEHVWLSLKNAKLFCKAIAERLGEIDPEGRAAYSANAEAYAAKLDALDEAYRSMILQSARKTVLFGDRFPFRYLVDDYGLEYYAAFAGCSAETEASFETVIFLADKVDALGLPAVLTIENSDGKLAQTIIASTETKSARVLRLDSLQSKTRQDINAGATYLGAMEQNLEILRQALQ